MHACVCVQTLPLARKSNGGGEGRSAQCKVVGLTQCVYKFKKAKWTGTVSVGLGSLLHKYYRGYQCERVRHLWNDASTKGIVLI